MAIMLATFLVVVLPALWFSGIGYMWLVEHVFEFDLDATPDGLVDGLLGLAVVLPIIPVTLYLVDGGLSSGPRTTAIMVVSMKGQYIKPK